MKNRQDPHRQPGRIEKSGNDAKLIASLLLSNPNARLDGYRIRHEEFWATKESTDRGHRSCDCACTIILKNGNTFSRQ